VRDGTIRLPFGPARTSPVAAGDVADVVTRYDRVTNDIAEVLGRSPSGFDSFVRNTAALRRAGDPADR
jgi:hypothetical protein